MTSLSHPTIESLCAQLFNESPHTEHVTALALRLFDATHAALGLPPRHRRLLEAAARLHDVAYSLDPLHHVTASADLVLHGGLRGFRAADLPLIAGIMLLHAGNLSAALNDLLFHELTTAQRDRVLRLGAFLRIADGLDYGHIQDATITGIRVQTDRVVVTVTSPLFPHNLARAERKADLWRKSFPLAIQLELAPATTTELLRADTPPPEAARRLLSLHYKTLLVNIDGALAGADPEPLHRVRVALRRLRVTVRLFRKRLPAELIKPIDDGLRELAGDLGPTRDLDVWLTLLQSEAARLPFAKSRLWSPFLQFQQRRRELAQASVRRGLRGAHFGALRHKLARLLRAELPRLTAATHRPVSELPALAKKRHHKSLRRIRKRAKLRHSTSGDKLHDLRVTLRQARDVGACLGELLEPRDRKRLRRLRDVEQILGRVHDLNVALETFIPEGPTPPRPLVKWLRLHHARQLDQLAAAWDRWEG